MNGATQDVGVEVVGYAYLPGSFGEGDDIAVGLAPGESAHIRMCNAFEQEILGMDPDGHVIVVEPHGNQPRLVYPANLTKVFTMTLIERRRARAAHSCGG